MILHLLGVVCDLPAGLFAEVRERFREIAARNGKIHNGARSRIGSATVLFCILFCIQRSRARFIPNARNADEDQKERPRSVGTAIELHGLFPESRRRPQPEAATMHALVAFVIRGRVTPMRPTTNFRSA